MRNPRLKLGMLLLCAIGLFPIWAEEVSQVGKQTLKALMEDYVVFRATVWRMHPAITDQGAPPALSGEEENASWYENAWARWLALPGWFVGFHSSAQRLEPRLRDSVWVKSNMADLRIWEHPGRQKIYVSLADEPERILAEFPAPEWQILPGETAVAFYEREVATRRVMWTFRSPYAPEAEVPLARSLMTLSAPVFRIVLDHATPNQLTGTVELGTESNPGPFVLWRHDSGIPNGWENLPGNWFPVHWQADRNGAEALTFDIDPAGGGGEHPLFLRATLGVTDSDSDGLDDGWELWFFGNMSQSAEGDFDNDGLSNAGEFQQGTNPSAADTDGDGLSDGDEITQNRNPLWRDHPDVGLNVFFLE